MAVAYRISDRRSLGGEISAQYLDADLNNAIDFGLINALDLGNAFPLIPSTPTSDGSMQVTGDDWGFGFNLGPGFWRRLHLDHRRCGHQQNHPVNAGQR
jgi:long-chain fatty acid transport protein